MMEKAARFKKAVRDGVVRVECSVEISSTFTAHEFPSPSLKDMLDSLAFTDATMTVRGEIIHVHRVVVSAYSSVIRCAFEGTFVESERRSIDVSDFDVRLVRAMVEYMYDPTVLASGDLHGKYVR